MSRPIEVLVVGGGLGGLATALSLRQRGLEVTVLEAARELGEVGAGIQTAPNASRILMGLGLLSQLRAIHTQPEEQVRRRWQDGSIIATKPLGAAVQQEYGAPYWHYHRADLHRVLLDACLDAERPGSVVRFAVGSRVTELDESDPLRPTAVTSRGDRYTADVVVGADGIRSQVRDLVGAPNTLVFSGEMAYRVLIPGKRIADDPATRFLVDRYHSTIWYGPDRHLVHYLIRGGQYLNVVGIVPCSPEIESTWSGSVQIDELAAAYPGWDDRVVAMLSKAEDNVTAWAMSYRRRDPRWVYGRVALLGDACHAMLPYQAQGASQAMEDAAVLAEELGSVTPSGIDGALVRYAARRAKHAGMVQEASLQNMHLYHLPDGPDQEARDSTLKQFNGESDVSYDWLWRGTPLNDPDLVPFDYEFRRTS